MDKIIYTPKILGEEAEEFSVVHDFLAYYYSKEVERVNGSKTGFYGSGFQKKKHLAIYNRLVW
ncbi:hypothetical protein P4S64_19210 [Vibrio sp. M60_M31a]